MRERVIERGERRAPPRLGSMSTWFRGGARKVCQVGSLEVTVGPQGGWLPNFLDRSWAERKLGNLGILGSQRFEAQRPALQWKRAVLLHGDSEAT